jgi:hypothetical protein
MLDALFGAAIMGAFFTSVLCVAFAAVGELPPWSLGLSIPGLALFGIAWYAGVVGPEE